MKKVYIVRYNDGSESRNCGVFATEEAANRYIAEQIKDMEEDFPEEFFYISEWEVQE